MPGVSSQTTAPTVEIQPGKGSWSTTRETVALPSPVRSLLASLNKRERVSTTKEMHWRKKMATRNRLQETDVTDITGDLEPVYHMATDWAEVIFFHQGSQLVDPVRVQGWRQKTAGVSIIPEWQPPSPISSGCIAGSRNPKNLLQTPLVRLPYSSDSQGDDESDDDSYEEVVPVISRPVTLSEHKTPTMSALFTPSSSLSTCNIKFLLSSEKFLALPTSIQNKLLSNLPAADQHSLLQHTNNLDSVLHNEYISAALREWQGQLILGSLQRKRSRQYEDPLPWKEAFYEDYWGDSKKKQVQLGRNNDQLFYPANSNYNYHQKLVHDIVFNYSTHLSVLNGSYPASSTHLLPVQLPLQAYRVHCISQQIQQEHSYCNACPIRSTLTLIVGSSCNCQTAPLQVCSSCHRLYHPTCSVVPRCPACITT